jgi:hypothetical protein
MPRVHDTYLVQSQSPGFLCGLGALQVLHLPAVVPFASPQPGQTHPLGCIANSPIQSYRYTVAKFPLPYKNVLKYRTRQNVGGIPILVFNTKCTRECRPHFAACGTPDRAMHSIILKTVEIG